MDGRDRSSSRALDERVAALEEVVDQLRPLSPRALEVLELIDARAYRQYTASARARFWGRAGKVAAGAGAGVVLLESLLQLFGVG